MNYVQGINSQVGQCCGVHCVTHSRRMAFTSCVSRVINDLVADRVSSKAFLLQVTPFYYQSRGTRAVCSNELRGS